MSNSPKKTTSNPSLHGEADVPANEQIEILHLQKSILEMVALDHDKDLILSSLCTMAEQLLPNAVASIMMLDKETGLLNITSAPSIPEEAHGKLNGLTPGPNGGSCGNAVFKNEPVFIMNPLVDPRTLEVREAINEFNLCACWSMPIRNAEGVALGSFALSSFEPRSPSEFHERLLEVAANIVGIIISRSEQADTIKAHENKLQLSAIAIKNASECIYITDHEKNIVEVNPAFERIFGFKEADILGKQAQYLASARHNQAFFDDLTEDLLSEEHWQGEIWHKHARGNEIPLWVSISAIKNTQGELQNYLAVCSDLTEIKSNQEKLKFLAYNDSLTGLANRIHFFDRVKHAIELAARGKKRLALLFIDINRFKSVNDTFGHSVGDGVLIEIAKRIDQGIRKQDTLARIGGDEFVALIENIPSSEAVYKLSEKILTELKKPITFQGRDFLLTGSIGIAIYPKDGLSEEVLLKHADTAMYQAKKTGSDISFYETELTQKAEKAFTIETDLNSALLNDDFELLYQPKVSAETLEVTSLEALIRWNHPDKGVISPADFIPIAEDTGLIIPIGEWVLKTALNQIQTWLSNKLPPIIVSVNISGRQLNSKDIDRLIDILNKSPVPSELIELELTETFLMSDAEVTILQLKKLRNTGVRLAIDDFGSGYSSLGYLTRFKVDVLKIDRLLVKDIETDPDDMAIAKGVVALGHSLGMTVVAEGVETLEQTKLLQATGCDELQGFYFYKPMSVDQLAEKNILTTS